jgi:S1-C subfamily serine protease
MNRFVYVCLFLIVFFINSVAGEQKAWALTQKAKEIYKSYHPSVYQIQIIDVGSNEKSAIGSGFKISKEGLFATNFHVISDVVEKPERYRIEYYQDGKSQGKLTIKTLDVSRDLAILQGKNNDAPVLSVGSSKLSKGDRVFPMGNPLDLGMTIIEGTFNGLVGDENYHRILLSASLNGGMSGGPALDTNGKVVGINVSIKGYALSYLVPVEYLELLVKDLDGKADLPDWTNLIQEQVLKKSAGLMGQIKKSKWTYENLGALKVPQNIGADSIKCWGKSEPEDIKEEQFFSYSHKACESENKIYLSSKLRTGTIGYSIIQLDSKVLGPLSFNENYSSEFSKSHFYPRAKEKDVHEFNCRNQFVRIAEHDWKGVYCVRQYKKYPKLHDAYLTFAVLGEVKRGYLIRIGLAGIDEKLSGIFLSKFLGGIQWIE